MADIIYNNSADFIFHNDEDIDTGDLWWMRNVPALTTDSVSDLTDDSVTANGTITELGGENSTRRGFCYKIGDTGDPTILDTVIYDDGDFSLGAFLEAIASLTTGKKYQIRAYAVNSAGVGYGITVYFITDLALSDSVIFADVLNNKNIGLNKSDSVIVADVSIKNIGVVESESLLLSDEIVKNVVLNKSDSILLADVINNFITLILKEFDTLIITDSMTNNPSLNKSESIIITDAIDNKNIGLVKDDSIILGDGIVKNISVPESDSIILGDGIVKNIGLVKSDSIILADVIVKSILSQLKVKQILSKVMTREVLSENIRQVNIEPRRRQVMCTPVDKQGTTDLLVFSPKQTWEEYYVAFNFARVITPLTTIQSTVILAYDEAGTEVGETFTDDTKTQITGAKVFVWVRGGTGQTYKITCRIIMSNGEKFEQDATLEVVEV